MRRSPEITSVAPTFLVSDVERTAAWYREKLGFETAGIFPKNSRAGWASLMRGRAEIMLQRLDGYVKPKLYDKRPGGVWDAYMRMRGVRAMFEALPADVRILMPLRKQPYGDWEFEVEDLNGYVLVFGGDEDVP